MAQKIAEYAVTMIAGAPIDMYILVDGSRRIGRRSVHAAMSIYANWAEKAMKELLHESPSIKVGGKCPEDKTLVRFGISNPLSELESADLMTPKEFAHALRNVAFSSVDMDAPPPKVDRKGSPEKKVQRRISKKTGGVEEVKCGAGFIDVLTNDSIIEIKKASMWKSAVGQVLAYGTYYPGRRKVICLFGASESFDWETVEQCCSDIGVEVQRA